MTTIAAAFGMLVGLGSSGIAAQAAPAAPAAPDATFNTLLATYTALADGGGSACIGGTPSTTGATTTCTIVQPQPGHTGRNVAVCVQNNTPGTIQVCDIMQTNTTSNNYALVIQRRSQNGGAVQEATQFADVEQLNGTGSNFLGEFQLITQTTGDANRDDPSQTNNQYLGSDSDETQQTATAGGSNFALLAQRSRQFGSAERAAQTQNSNQVGRLNQVDTPGGRSLNLVSQEQLQHLEGDGPQTQTVDPRCCTNQGTNPNDSFNIRQQTVQEGGPQAAQDAKTVGTCQTTGKCTVIQSSTQQGTTTTNQCGPASFCAAAITCTKGVCTPIPACFASDRNLCPPPPPCQPTVCPQPTPLCPPFCNLPLASLTGTRGLSAMMHEPTFARAT
ncbi:MAG: hypothetical protein M3Z11_07090 [Candidatus Dormibacteraeota bacterium]|nr:hypothetical protein [Candidatus Dormibacteraeota bacterium]